ncbi:MAG: hypothetical protein JO318_00120 [Chloroflexi bacterium]|nr:hypothetical protein [Chloroflexota bacterium]
MRPQARPAVWRCCGAALAGGAIALVLLILFFGAAVLLLRAAAAVMGVVLELNSALDPVYTRAALRSLTDSQLQGLAVAGPPGVGLHTLWPDVFADASRAHWLPIRLVLVKGSPLIARLVAAGAAHAVVVGLGLLLMRYGLRQKNANVMTAGLAMQVVVGLGIVGNPPTLRELDSTGASFAANALLPWLIARGQSISDAAAAVPAALVAASLVALALLVAYVPSATVLLLRARHVRLSLAAALAVVLTSAACAGALTTNPPVDTAAPALAFGDVTQQLTPPAVATSPPTLDRWYADTPTDTVVVNPSPSHVEVQGGNGSYTYLVNGHPEVIKGMGLNTQYASQLSPDERARQLDSDMAELQSLGVNTVLGWDPAEFDEVLLDAAQRHGIGVIVPFELDPDADYTDPAVRQQLHDQVIAWVARYRNHPALRMWGLGNEVLHKIVHPAWVGPQDPQRDANAQAFSDWLIATADDVHAADPDHPVTYREAEDAFVPWLAAAVQRAGGQPRPWFVFGTNCYQDYLSQIVDNWPISGLPTALWVSEFAPGTMAVPDRPDGFGAMWGLIRAHPDYVLGGAVYAWTRNGPEGVDRNFGLTDDGVPVDGRSLDMLSSLFHDD